MVSGGANARNSLSKIILTVQLVFKMRARTFLRPLVFGTAWTGVSGNAEMDALEEARDFHAQRQRRTTRDNSCARFAGSRRACHSQKAATAAPYRLKASAGAYCGVSACPD